MFHVNIADVVYHSIQYVVHIETITQQSLIDLESCGCDIFWIFHKIGIMLIDFSTDLSLSIHLEDFTFDLQNYSSTPSKEVSRSNLSSTSLLSSSSQKKKINLPLKKTRGPGILLLNPRVFF